MTPSFSRLFNRPCSNPTRKGASNVFKFSNSFVTAFKPCAARFFDAGIDHVSLPPGGELFTNELPDLRQFVGRANECFDRGRGPPGISSITETSRSP